MVGGAVRDAAGNIIMGLMSRPNTAALDPIFWLHHANIDPPLGGLAEARRRPEQESDR
jgi:tyrosinase